MEKLTLELILIKIYFVLIQILIFSCNTSIAEQLFGADMISAKGLVSCSIMTS